MAHISLLGNFSGEQNEVAKFFFKQFKAITKLRKLRNEDRLKAKLKNDALKFMTANQELRQETCYETVRDRIIDFFTPKANISTSHIKISQIKQPTGESIKSLANCVKNAVIEFLDIGWPKQTPEMKK